MNRKILLLLAAFAASAVPAVASAQIIDPFSSRFSGNHPGDIELVGNSMLTCTDGVNSCALVRDGTLSIGDIANNNDHEMVYVDVDTDPTTFNSSSALAGLPVGSRVLWAGLYWGGRTEQGVGGAAAPDRSLRDRVLMRAPGGASYQNVTATECQEAAPHGDGGVTGGIYQCFAEVTNQLPSALSGTITVANLQTGTGANRFGGWGVVVAYEDPSQQLRNLVVYDGFARVLSQDTVGSVTIQLSGFTSPATGDVVTRVGAIAYEGDRGADGDSFRIDGTQVSGNNFFDAGITDRGANVTNRSPAHDNNLGFDLKRAELINFLANGSSTAELTLDTTLDRYFPGVVTFATALQAPELVVLKDANDLNGDDVAVGDELEYVITVRNDGGDGATLTSLTDILPSGLTYVTGSGSVDGASVTDAAGDDVYTYDAGSRSIEVNLGAGATAFTGGYVAPNAQTVVRFRAKIDEDLSEGDRIENQAAVQYVTETLQLPDTKVSDGDLGSLGANPTITIIESAPKFVDVTTPADGSMILERRPTIRGTSNPNATLEVVVGGQTVTVTADAAGNWSYTPAADLPLGANTVTATVVGTNTSDSHTFTIVEEGIEITAPAPGTVTDDTTPTVTGKATPNATVEVTLDGMTATVTADGNGDWSYTPATPLAAGPYTATATIPGTNATDSTNFTVTTDRVDITSPGPGETTDVRPTVTGTAPPGATVVLEVGDETVTLTADANGDWSYTPTQDLTDGPQTATATQGTAVDTVTFNVDADGGGTGGSTPEVELLTPTEGGELSNPPRFSGTATPGAEVVITVDGIEVGRTTANPDGTWSYTPDDALDPGPHDVVVTVTIGDDTARDSAGFTTPGLGAAGKIARGGACSVASPAGSPGSPSLLLVLLLPMLVGRGRRRAVTAIAALTALVAPSVAQAQQELTSFQVEHFEPLPAPTRNVLNVATSESAKHLEIDLGLLAHYVNDPLQYSNPDGSEAERAISNQVKAELSVNLGLFDLFELGLVLPVVLFQNGDDLASFGRPGETVDGGGLADVRLIPKVTLLKNDDAAGFGIALAVPMYAPIGDTSTFNSDGGFRLEPRLIADWRSDWGLTFAANVAYQLLRSDQAVYNFVSDDILRWGVATRVPTPVERLAITGSVFGNASFQEARQVAGVQSGDLDTSRPIELLAGAEYGINETLIASLGGGAGLTRGVGAPDFRVLAGIAYAPADEVPEEPATPSRPDPEIIPAPGDADGDGILDPDDKCPNEPEDIDAFEDLDGCPDLDDDDDGILDVDDSCRLDPEDVDGFKDLDGCPDPDNDGDGILDINDSCPLVPELLNNIRDEDGCPEKDTDGDGILDPVDQCPDEPETYNGKDDEDGCPDGKQTVVITKSEIKILKRVYFATNKDVIKRRSYNILDTVAIVLRQNPQVKLIRIGGHTDDMGKDDYNLDLSQRRADAVRDYLIRAGIDSSRLSTKGFGEDEPLCKDIPQKMLGKRSRKLKECRATNRRVEFKILEIDGADTVRDTE